MGSRESNSFEIVRKNLYAAVQKNRRKRNNGRFATSDVVQEGCLQIWQHVQAAKDESGENEFQSAWLRTLAIGHLCKFFRFNHAKKRSVGQEEDADLAMLTDATSELPDMIAETRELAIKLLQSLAELEERERQIIVQKFFEGHSLDRIASELGMTRYRVTQVYHSTIQNLQKALSQ